MPEVTNGVDPSHVEPGLPGMVALTARSARFANGLFHHLTQTADAAACREHARQARAGVPAGDPHRWIAVATAAWWDAVADRCKARSWDQGAGR